MFSEGRGLKIAMIDKNDFFRDQIEQCRNLAERARNKTDREFWLRLAQRWEELRGAKQPESHGSGTEPVPKRRYGARFTRRQAA
jgi:hypothetical protein